MVKNPLLIILGPTASGKTKLAVSLASELHAEIISADSRQVFKGMDIGTGKDLDEYIVNGKQVPYHLIDHMIAGSRYQVDAFKEDFFRVFDSLTARQVLPLLCGGTGMYIHSILQNHQFTMIPVNPMLRERLSSLSLIELQELLLTYPVASTAHADHSTIKRLVRAIEIAEYIAMHQFIPVQRTSFTPLVIGLTTPVELRRNRIMLRLVSRLEHGLIEEVESLLRGGVTREMLDFYGLEYKFIVSYIFKEISYEQLQSNLFTAICQYAKRQMTFYRKMEKDGVKIDWFDADDPALKISVRKLIAERWMI